MWDEPRRVDFRKEWKIQKAFPKVPNNDLMKIITELGDEKSTHDEEYCKGMKNTLVVFIKQYNKKNCVNASLAKRTKN